MSEKPLTRAQIAELCGCRPAEIPASPLYSLTSYVPPGPKAAGYINSVGPVDAITGPAGSGKTVATVFKCLRFSVSVMPVCVDNIVRVRGFVLRDNYRALYRTTLRSWFEFLPPNYGGAVFTGGADRPAQHILKLSTVRVCPDGQRREVPVDLTVDFFAVGDVSIEELLKGYEPSWGWASEADLLAPRVVPFAYGRTGRYPPLDKLPEAYRSGRLKRPRMIAADFNPPSPRHPLWKAVNAGTFQALNEGSDSGVVADLPVGDDGAPLKTINFFHQPSGLSPDAENRRGKTYEAYLEEARTLPEEDVQRFVHGLPGFASDGKPVYVRQFNRHKHVAGGPLPVLQGVALDIGLDQGLTPAALLSQTSPHGQFRSLAELVPGHNVGVGRFCQMLVALLMSPRFRECRLGTIAADPAGFYGGDKEGGELAWAMAVGQALGKAVYPAPSNEVDIRLESVRHLLRTDIDANTPGFLVDPGCALLIEGFEAEYKFPKFKPGSAAGEIGDRPVKNLHANVHDALQYGVLATRGLMGAIGDAARAGRAGQPYAPGSRAPREKPGDFSVWSV